MNLAQLLDRAARLGYNVTPMGLAQLAQEGGNYIMDKSGEVLGDAVFDRTEGLSPEIRGAASAAPISLSVLYGDDQEQR